jgi:hypothetical protein
MGAIELPEIDLNLDGRDFFLAARQCVDRSTWIGSGRRHSSVPVRPHWRTSRARPNSSGQISIRQSPRGCQKPPPAAMLGVIERLEKVGGIGIEPGRSHLVHQARPAQLAREAGRSTVQHVANYV